MTIKKSSVLKNAVYITIAVGLVLWIREKIDFEKLVDDIKNADYFWVGMALVAGIISHFIRAYRWKFLIEPLGHKSRLSTSFYSVMIGYLVNYLLPRVGEVVRCAAKGRADDIPVDKLVGTVITERIFDLLATMLITVVAVAVQYDLIWSFLSEQFQQNQEGSQTKIIVLGILAVMAVVGWLIYRNIRRRKLDNPWVNKIFAVVERLLDGVKSIFHMKRPILFIALTLGIWAMYFAMAYLIFFAIDGTSHLGVNAALSTLVMSTVAMIIPAPGGIGSFHYFVPLGLGLYGIDQTTGTSYAAISHGSQMLMIIVVGLVSLLLITLERRKKQANVQSAEDK